MRALWALGLAAFLGVAVPAAGQGPRLRVSDGRSERLVSVATSRGWAAVDVAELAALGWSVAPAPAGVLLKAPDGSAVEVRDGSPYVRWGGSLLQMVDVPYFEEGKLLVPLQLLSDFLPWRLPDRYAFDGSTLALRMKSPGSAAPREQPREQPRGPRAAAVAGRRMVVIDAGHGGEDPGSISRSGVQEKTVALGVALALAEALRGQPGLDVRLIREDDTLVPLWERGARATRMKGEEPGIFVSVHANSFTNSARGFETYFLSDARTEHEQRVAAMENAPLALGNGEAPPQGDLDFILRELKNLDTAHWSSLLAEMVQQEVAKVHPGPDRGVKQAPLAVITNALMPSVLVEIGYLSHPEEARLLARSDFQAKAGQAIAAAVLRFFERYPPGSGGGAGAGR